MLQQRLFVAITCFETENDQYVKRALRERYPGRNGPIKKSKQALTSRNKGKSERRLTVRTPENVVTVRGKTYSCRRNTLRIAKTTLNKTAKQNCYGNGYLDLIQNHILPQLIETFSNKCVLENSDFYRLWWIRNGVSAHVSRKANDVLQVLFQDISMLFTMQLKGMLDLQIWYHVNLFSRVV